MIQYWIVLYWYHSRYHFWRSLSASISSSTIVLRPNSIIIMIHHHSSVLCLIIILSPILLLSPFKISPSDGDTLFLQGWTLTLQASGQGRKQSKICLTEPVQVVRKTIGTDLSLGSPSFAGMERDIPGTPEGCRKAGNMWPVCNLRWGIYHFIKGV